jgi:hypothetical protein
MGVKGGLGEFCRCIKKVRRSVTPRPGSNKESAAIGICVKSVLQTRGRTLRKFSCKGTRRRGRKGKPFLQTKKLVGGGRRTRRKPLSTIPEENETSNAENAKNREAAEVLAFAEKVALLSQQYKSEMIAKKALNAAGIPLTKPLWTTPTPHSSATGTQPHSSRRSTP